MNRRVDMVVVQSKSAPGLLSLRGEDGRGARAVLTTVFECGDVVTVVQRHEMARLERVFELTKKFLHQMVTDVELTEMVELTAPHDTTPQTTAQLRQGAP